MSKLKSLRNFFFVVDEDEDDVVPAEAASDDIEVAAKAARERMEEGPVGREPSGKTMGNYVDDPYLGEFEDDAFMDATPNLSSPGREFDEVYAAAGLPPADSGGFTIYKVEKILQSQHLADLGDKAKAATVLVTLEASGVGLTAMIQDAVGRDKALDQYDAMLRRDIKNLQTDIEITNVTIEQEIAEYLERKRQEIATNNAKLQQAQELYHTWRIKKEAEEERLYRAVAPFVAENPITQDDS